MEALNREKSLATRSHPSAPGPASGRNRATKESYYDRDPETALYTRLAQIGRLESWIQQRLRAELSAHLEATSPAYQCGMRIQQALNEWEFCVRHVLPDSLAEFARELRGFRQTVEGTRRRETDATAAELLALRRIAKRVEDQQLQIARISAAIAGHAQQFGASDVLPPTLPNFRRLVWVDWLTVVPVEQRLLEITRIESEIRSFLNRGLAATLGLVQSSRNACSARQDAVLQEYWQRLRAYAQSHFIEESELDAVLDSLSFRYEPEITRREGTRIRPFAEI